MLYLNKPTPTGFRSKFEETIAQQLADLGIIFRYEDHQRHIKYTLPAKVKSYLPDFILPNNIVIEVKGYFTKADRIKHLAIASAAPHIDLRFVFQNAYTSLHKNGKMTYARWCELHGFRWAHKFIPLEWIKEDPRDNL